MQGVVAIPLDWQIQADVLLSSGLRPKQVVDAMILGADKAGECITDVKALHRKVSAAPQCIAKRIHSSRLTTYSSQLTHWSQPTAHYSRLTIDGSTPRFTAHGPQLTAHSPHLTAHEPQFTAAYFQLTIHSSQPTTHPSQLFSGCAVTHTQLTPQSPHSSSHIQISMRSKTLKKRRSGGSRFKLDTLEEMTLHYKVC